MSLPKVSQAQQPTDSAPATRAPLDSPKKQYFNPPFQMVQSVPDQASFRMSPFWDASPPFSMMAQPAPVASVRPGMCSPDIDGDLIIEDPHQDRIADVPMVQMVSQSITVGLVPEVSGSVVERRSSDYEVTLNLNQSFSMQLSGFLSVEGGFNSSVTGDTTTAGKSMGFNAKESLQYDLKTELTRQAVVKRLNHVESGREVRITPKSGYVSIQFQIRNSGSQAVALSAPSFAVLSRIVDRNGNTRTITIVPDQPISQSSSPIYTPGTGGILGPGGGIIPPTVGMPTTPSESTITLGPGETRTISLRLTGQDSSMILELLKSSEATWATLHFGKQTAIADAKVNPDGSVTPGSERDISRDMVASIRKKTIPFYFVPPPTDDTALGMPRTTLFAATPPGVISEKGELQCLQDNLGRVHIGATLPDLLHYHGQDFVDWGHVTARKGSHGPFWILPQIGPVASTLPENPEPVWLSSLPSEERRKLGRWELQVLHRDYGAIEVRDLQNTRLGPEHSVVLRWVDGETVLSRMADNQPIRRQIVSLSDTQSTPIPVRPGSLVRLQIKNVTLDRPLLGERLLKDEQTSGGGVRSYGVVNRGTTFPVETFAGEIRHQVHFRYAYMTPDQAARYRNGVSATIDWEDAWADPSGTVMIQVPTRRMIPANAQLVVETERATVRRRSGNFSVDGQGNERDGHWYWRTGRIFTESYRTTLDGTVEVVSPITQPQ